MIVDELTSIDSGVVQRPISCSFGRCWSREEIAPYTQSRPLGIGTHKLANFVTRVITAFRTDGFRQRVQFDETSNHGFPAE